MCDEPLEELDSVHGDGVRVWNVCGVSHDFIVGVMCGLLGFGLFLLEDALCSDVELVKFFDNFG